VKGKSSHDLLNDNTLSSLPAVDADDEDECNYIVQVKLLPSSKNVGKSLARKHIFAV